jgi:sugar phosphate permease
MSVFLGRTAMLDWAQLYLVQDLGHDQYVGEFIFTILVEHQNAFE